MPSDKKNSFWLALQYFSTVIFSFIIIKLSIDHFGTELFGMWLVFSSLWGLGSTIDLGFGISIIKFIAVANKENDQKKIDIYVSSSLTIFIAIGLLIVLIFSTVAEVLFFNNNNIVPIHYQSTAYQLLILLGINFYLRYMLIFLKSIFEGFNNFVLTSKLSIFNDLSIFISILFIIYYNLNLVSLAYCYASISTINLGLSYFLLKKNYKKIEIKLRNFNLPIIKNMIRFSFNVQLTSIFGALIDPLAKYIIGNFSSLSIVSLYEIGRRFAIALSGLFFNTFRTILPKVSVLKTIEESRVFLYEQTANLIRIGITYSGFAFGISSIIVAGLIKIWFDLDEAILIFLILALPECINNFGYPTYMYILGTGKADFLAALQLINLITAFIALIIGFKIFNSYLALYGYTLSVLIGNILMLFFIRKNAQISIRRFLKKINIYKFFILLLILFAVVIVSYNENINIFILLGIVSITSLILFIKDIKEYYMTFFRLLRKAV